MDERLHVHLPSPDDPAQLVRSAMHYAVDGGHRWRPILLITAFEAAAAGDGAEVLDAACAVELIHCCTIVIDDLPCVDNNTQLRRGRPSCHTVYGEAVTIYASHLLYALAETLACENARSLGTDERPVRRHLGELRERLVKAQELELNLNRAPAAATDAVIAEFYELKSCPFISAVWLACALGGVGGARRQSLLSYAKCLGTAYQLADDILDAEGEPAVMGKPVRKDQGKVNHITRHGVARSKDLMRHLMSDAEGALAALPGDTRVLRELLYELTSPVLESAPAQEQFIKGILRGEGPARLK